VNQQKLRQPGRSRSEYLQLLQRDLCFYYGYNECMMERFLQIFSLDEVQP
jgi:ribosomal RNA methyltransferase Nop2